MSRPENGRRRSTPGTPRRPYRDSAILYACLAGLVVVVAALTGGNLVRAVFVAVGCFIAAMGWTWFRRRSRLQRESGR